MMSPIISIPKVQKTSLVFRSDLKKSDHAASIVTSGILHAIRYSSLDPGISVLSSSSSSSNNNNNNNTNGNNTNGGRGGREEHAYAWISDYTTQAERVISSRFVPYGFELENVKFVPYTNKSSWVSKYPNAYPYVSCDNDGIITGYPFWSYNANCTADVPLEVVDATLRVDMVDAISRSERMREGESRIIIGGSGGGGGGGRVVVRPPPGGRAGAGAGARLSDSVLLTNAERNALHVEIYRYFSWLSDTVIELETGESGRRSVRRAGYTAGGLRGLLTRMEGTFGLSADDLICGGGTASTTTVEGEEKVDPDDVADNKADDDDRRPLPLLEGSLVGEMSDLAAAAAAEGGKGRRGENRRCRSRSRRIPTPSSHGGDDGFLSPEGTTTTTTSTSGGAQNWEPLDFDVMFGRLVAYAEVNGHPNVPVKFPDDPQLGGWVSGLRTKKKAYGGDVGDVDEDDVDDDGDDDAGDDDAATGEPTKEDEVRAEGGDDEAIAATANDTSFPPPSTASHGQKYLNPERIRRLESIGFSWSMSRPKTKPRSWEDRLDDLRKFREENGSYNVPRSTSLGEWLHNQRTLYGKRDTRFMTRKAPRMIEIGYKFDLRENNSVSWDDRYQQLAEYGRMNGNFDVPCPTSASDDVDGGDDDEAEVERFKFYKWVNRLHNEYRAYEKGTSSKLNAERIARLRSVGFRFKGPKNRGRPSGTGLSNPVPKIPFEKRIQQLQAFKADTGHLDVDHNYKHCSNLGGWAADVSAQYASWKSGTTRPTEDAIARFDQLARLGFQFNCLPYYESNRSWEDHYEVLLKFKERNNGSARVPLKYKADLRLGKWVQSQRQQYKLLKEGKKSKLTDERIEKLEAVGFEWALLPGSTKDDDEEDDEMEGYEEEENEIGKEEI